METLNRFMSESNAFNLSPDMREKEHREIEKKSRLFLRSGGVIKQYPMGMIRDSLDKKKVKKSKRW